MSPTQQAHDFPPAQMSLWNFTYKLLYLEIQATKNSHTFFKQFKKKIQHEYLHTRWIKKLGQIYFIGGLMPKE
jgi:hypothetical protein